MKLISILSLAACLIAIHISCASRQAVVASTGTMIGVEISENPANASLQAKLGYNRAEIALVPTNRSADKEPGNVKNGASDVADVLMELRYGGIFSSSDNSVIYQRLAVGSEAVRQPGAAFMFAKGIDPDTAQQVREALAGVPEHTPSGRIALKTLSEAYMKMPEKKSVFDQAASDATNKEFENFSKFLSGNPSQEQMSKVKELLLQDQNIKKKLEEIESKKEK